MEPQDSKLISHVGPLEVDWPGAVGYYGGIALAVSIGILEPPLALFIAAVPFFKLLNRPNSALPSRALSQLLDGASKPVGGDSEMVIQVTDKPQRRTGLLSGAVSRVGQETAGIWSEAKVVARGESSSSVHR